MSVQIVTPPIALSEGNFKPLLPPRGPHQNKGAPSKQCVLCLAIKQNALKLVMKLKAVPKIINVGIRLEGIVGLAKLGKV